LNYCAHYAFALLFIYHTYFDREESLKYESQQSNQLYFGQDYLQGGLVEQGKNLSSFPILESTSDIYDFSLSLRLPAAGPGPYMVRIVFVSLASTRKYDFQHRTSISL
jgi:hypothetical protein